MDGMIKPLKIVTSGGDLRISVLARLFREDGHDVSALAAEKAPVSGTPVRRADEDDLHRAELLILPLPAVGQDGFINAPLSDEKLAPEEIFAKLNPSALIAAGKVSDSLRETAAKYGFEISDYLDREELAVQNAIPTAEGAIEIAMGALGITLHRANALVIGFGRIGKLLSLKLRALGAEVTATARKYSDLAWIDALGCDPLRTENLIPALGRCDVVFNTVPARVLGRAELAELRQGVPIIDLASKPGGVDMEAALGLGREVIWALSLPGRVAPATAGRIIRDTVYNILDSSPKHQM